VRRALTGMSDREFEIYLSLLQRLLRLSARQRAEIAEELRGHLEERCEELVREGYSRAEAIQAALDEFGDAAELAQQFTQIALQRRRRLIMRWSMATTAVAAGLFVLLTAFWPGGDRSVQEFQVAAQPAKTAKKKAVSEEAKPNRQIAHEYNPDHARKQAEEKLKMPISLDFADTPLARVLDFIRDATDLCVVCDRVSMEEEGVTPQTPVTVYVQDTSLANALELLLDPMQLGFTLREGVIFVRSKAALQSDMEVRVYECDDLLEAAERAGKDPVAAAPGKAAGQQVGQLLDAVNVYPDAAALANAAGQQVPMGAGQSPMGFYGPGRQPRGGMAGSAGMGSGEGGTPLGGSLRTSRFGALEKLQLKEPRLPEPQHCTLEALAAVIIECTDADWEVIDGKGGGIGWFGTTLVVRQTYQVHRQVAEILHQLRQAYGLERSSGKDVNR